MKIGVTILWFYHWLKAVRRNLMKIVTSPIMRNCFLLTIYRGWYWDLTLKCFMTFTMMTNVKSMNESNENNYFSNESKTTKKDFTLVTGKKLTLPFLWDPKRHRCCVWWSLVVHETRSFWKYLLVFVFQQQLFHKQRLLLQSLLHLHISLYWIISGWLWMSFLLNTASKATLPPHLYLNNTIKVTKNVTFW